MSHAARRAFIALPYPPSSNEYWKPAIVKGRPCIVPTALAEKYKSEIRTLLEKHLGPRIFAAGDVKLVVAVYRPQKSGDTSNRLKVLEDALNETVWSDDRQVARIEIERFDTDPSFPRVEVWIEHHAQRQPPPPGTLPDSYWRDFDRARAAIEEARRVRREKKKAKARAGNPQLPRLPARPAPVPTPAVYRNHALEDCDDPTCRSHWRPR